MAAIEDLARAVEEGRKAFRRGDSYLACHYPRPSALRTAWLSGFHERLPFEAEERNFGTRAAGASST